MSILKLQLSSDSEQRVWITSDSHFGHKNICRGVTDWRNPDGSIPFAQTRDFRTIDEMNEAIVYGFNHWIGEDDMIIHGGDWSFGGFENIQKFWDRVVCKNIHLVLGNHDAHIKKNRDGIRDLFLSVSDRLEIHYDKKLIVVDHYPISSWEDMSKGSIHLHGHSHLSNTDKISFGRRMDIGIDGSPQFRPYDLYRECVVPLKLRPIEFGMKNDHHGDEIENNY